MCVERDEVDKHHDTLAFLMQFHETAEMSAKSLHLSQETTSNFAA